MVQSSFSLQKCYVTLCASFCLWRKRSSRMWCEWMKVDNIWDKLECYSLCGIGGGKQVCLRRVGASLVPSQKMWLLSFRNAHCYKSLSLIILSHVLFHSSSFWSVPCQLWESSTVVYNFPPVLPNVASRFQEIYLLSQEKFGTGCV